MAYRITIALRDTDTEPGGQVYQQDFDELDLSETIRLLNAPKRKARADRGTKRKGAEK